MQGLVSVINETPVDTTRIRDQLIKDHQTQAEVLFRALSEVCDSPSAETTALLYGDHVHPIQSARAEKFLLATSAKRVGIFTEETGAILVRGGREVFSQLFAQCQQRYDRGVYEKGGAIRSRGGAKWQSGSSLPIQLYVGLTQLCNRHCDFCVSRTFEPASLTIKEVRSIAEQLGSRIDVVALTGAGEALLHPHFWDTLDIFSTVSPGVAFKMNTSGVTLGRVAGRIIQYPFRNITVSLNAATEKTYRRHVGEGFDTVLSGIQALVRERAHAGRHELTLTLSIVLMNSTFPELPDFVSRAFELGVEEVQGIYLMINSSELEQESPWYMPEHSNELLDRAAARGRLLGINCRFPPHFNRSSVQSNTYQPSSLPTTQGQRCVEPWSTVYVRPNGDVISCPYSEASMGNIRRESLTQIWQNPKYQHLRETLISEKYWNMCKHCCGFNETGHVDDLLSHWLGDRGP
jgi:radical SAM protein with 4Fe4S-binding SPASM domain